LGFENSDVGLGVGRSGFRGLRFEGLGSGVRGRGLRLRAEGLGFRVWRLGFRI